MFYCADSAVQLSVPSSAAHLSLQTRNGSRGTLHIFREEIPARHYLLRGGAILNNKVDSLGDCK